MARGKSIEIQEVLTSLIPARRLNRLARELGVVVRHRKVRALALFWTLVLGFGAGSERTLAGLRRHFEQASGVTLVPSAFYLRFTPALARFLKAVLVEVLERVSERSEALKGPLGAFRDVVSIDATVIRLHDLLAKAFPACRTNHTRAAAKLHAVMSVKGAGPRSVKLTSERVHEGPVLRAGKWVAGLLLLFDLGYYRYQLFDCIERCRGYFITRLKDRANPTITAVHRRWRGASLPLVGRRLQDVLGRLKREVLDVEVELTFRRRAYNGKRSAARARFRLVGVRNPKGEGYHLYLTNVPPEKLSAEDIAATYAARWTIELVFRELKRHYRLDQMPSASKPVVEALLYAALLTLVVSRTLLAALRQRLKQPAHRLPEERWAALFAQFAQQMLWLLLSPRSLSGSLAKRLARVLAQEAVDPNRSRRRLLGRVESGTQLDHYAGRSTSGSAGLRKAA
jgi:IS4 transposase